MPTQTARALPSETLDALSALYTRTVDAKAGFDKMAEHAEPGFRPTVALFKTCTPATPRALPRC